MSRTLDTDLYELNMAASYLRHAMTKPATFSLFCHNLPPDRGFLIAAGLEDCLSFLEEFSFDEEDLVYLRAIGFSKSDVERFATLRFTGDVRAMPEGTVFYAGEPLLEVTAPIAEAQLVETYLLNQASFQSMLASKAARCRLAAAGRIDLVDFSMRRTQGIEAATAAARLSAMCGFVATSNVEAARRFGLVPAGTMAHSYIQAFPSEIEAFTAFASEHEGPTTFLVDTYDTETGVRNAITVMQQQKCEDGAGIRIDSGDLAALARRARQLLDEAGLYDVRIFVSGGLDEHDIEAFVASSAPIDAAGVGTKMGVSADAPFLDTAYKLVEYDGRPVMKLSTGKATLPGRKQVFRQEGKPDVIGCAEEEAPPGYCGLLEPVMTAGKRTIEKTPLHELRRRVDKELEALPEAVRSLSDPTVPEPTTSKALLALEQRVREALLEIEAAGK